MLTTTFAILGLGSLFALACRAAMRDCEADPNDAESIRACLAENRAKLARKQSKAHVAADADLARVGEQLIAAQDELARVEAEKTEAIRRVQIQADDLAGEVERLRAAVGRCNADLSECEVRLAKANRDRDAAENAAAGQRNRAEHWQRIANERMGQREKALTN